MPKLIIDKREIDVVEGTKVIEAAEQLGIMIPRFCFHPALGAVGACRVCAVKFEEGPIKGIEMSCMVNAQDGMRISTSDPEAVDFRRHVVEWLMLNHPHDCPVCDEGGQCLLQDMTVSSGHALRRYTGRKRTHLDQDLGPLVQHEMNRCIQCYRCVRFYREYTGYPDLGVMGIGSRVYFGRRRSGTLESPFSGNLVDICPTGVFTDKPSRFAGRRWDFVRQASICIHCGLGCHVTTSVHHRRVVRQEARFSPHINGYFICDRGRYGFDYANRDDRPRNGRVAEREVTWSESLVTAEAVLAETVRQYGPQSLALVSGHRTALETLLALKHLCRKREWPAPVFWQDRCQSKVMKAMAAHYTPESMADPMDLAAADLILAVGVDPLNQAPMLAPAMRRAALNGSRIVMVHPGPLALPFEYEHWVEPPTAFNPLLRSILALLVQADEQHLPEAADSKSPLAGRVVEIVRLLLHSKQPVIIVGSELAGHQTVALTSAVVQAAAPQQARMMMVVPGANALGAALIDEAGADFNDVLERIEAGLVKALVLAEHDPLWDFPDLARVQKALQSLEHLIVLDHLNSAAARLATVFIPTRTVFEAGGTFINHVGRVQRARPLFRGGLSISRTGNGDHPPRQFRRDIPGADLPSAGEALWHLVEPGSHLDHTDIEHRLWQGHANLWKALEPENAINGRVQQAYPRPALEVDDPAEWAQPPDGFRLLLTEAVFGTEILSGQSTCLHPLEPVPRLYISPTDAEELGMSDGDRVSLHVNETRLTVTVAVQAGMARGFLALPRLRDTHWQIFNRRAPILDKHNLQRLAKGDQ